MAEKMSAFAARKLFGIRLRPAIHNEKIDPTMVAVKVSRFQAASLCLFLSTFGLVAEVVTGKIHAIAIVPVEAFNAATGEVPAGMLEVTEHLSAGDEDSTESDPDPEEMN